MSDIVDLLESSSSSSSTSSDDSSSTFEMYLDDNIEENQENPYQSLIRLHNSYSNSNERKNAVKYILDALRSVNELEQIYEILSCTKNLADDNVAQVQIDCLEKFVSIIEYLVQNIENADILIRDYLFQSIIQTIGHANNRIRKSSQSSLIRLFELEQIRKDDIETEVIPSLCQLDRACDDFKNESIVLMTRLTQYISIDLVLKYFLPTIIEQSSSIAFQTRKTCATSLGDLTNILPTSAIDQYIVPCLSNLCSDPFWGVRKSCAEVIHPIAQLCSFESRWNILSPCLIQLLQDQSRWVKTAALRVLGYFISTFAQSIEKNSSETNQNQNQTEETNRNHENNNEQSIISINNLINDLTLSIDQSIEINRNIEQEFNDFNYWKKNQYLIMNIDDDPNLNNEKSILESSSMKSRTPYEKSKEYSINDIRRIVPIELIDFYRSLIEQSYTSGIETDIVHQGAFTFPAVALTLGNQHWHLIKDIHKKFSEDLQWKVRRTLAYSLHCLAQILTREQVENDLCPIFDSFISDVDEVKIGILSHLSEFLEYLHPTTRQSYLDKLTILTTVDNQRNWRFRFESANQLNRLTTLFSSTDVFNYVSPLIFALSIDKVYDVRQSSIKALSSCYLKYWKENDLSSLETFDQDCQRIFASSNDWKFRQSYINLCQSIYFLHCHTIEEYSLKFLQNLIHFHEDPVVNVRLTLAKFLQQDFLKDENYFHLSLDLKNQIQQTIEHLSKDQDRDVRLSINESNILINEINSIDLK